MEIRSCIEIEKGNKRERGVRAYLDPGESSRKTSEVDSRPFYAFRQYFVDFYNKKFPDAMIEISSVSMQRKGGHTVARDEDLISDRFEAYDDIYVVQAPSIEETEDAKVDENEGKVRCRNYGCNQMFDPSKNNESSCRHHVAPPIFHDTKKGWSCCKQKMVYDWSDFEAIEGCQTGPHSTEDPKIKFAPSPTVAVAQRANEKHAAKLKTAADFNKENPDAVSAASSAKKSVEAAKARPAQKDDKGRLKCIRKGCNQWYYPDENGDSACTYHPMKPIFHDTKKFYACCEHRVAYDFDDFLKIEGCQKGRHASTHDEE